MDNRLPIIRTLVEELNKAGIRYCHFKSNKNLLSSIRGETDLDVLFEEKQQSQVHQILLETGFVKFRTAWFLKYSFVEDYIGIDPFEGQLVHVHAHFRLTIGEIRVKSSRYPGENQILDNRVWYDQEKIYASAPVDELWLLIIRMALKLPAFPLNLLPSQKNKLYSEDEFSWLKNKVPIEKISRRAESDVDSANSQIFHTFYENGLTHYSLKKFKKRYSKFFKELRRISVINAFCRRWIRGFMFYLAQANKRLEMIKFTHHRRLPENGFIVSIMGADGSGKSTQTERLKEILRKKADTVFIYMGSGAGRASFQRWLIETLLTLHKRKKKKKTNNSLKGHQFPPKRGKPFYTRVAEIILATSLAFERRAKLRRALKHKRRGAFVICDRYPQTQMLNLNDGPRLNEFLDSKNPIIKKLARFEHNSYEMSERIPPDIVIKLLADTETLYQRRSDTMHFDVIKFKNEGVQKIKFPSSKVGEIDAAMTPDQVTSAIVAEIGKELSKPFYQSNNKQ